MRSCVQSVTEARDEPLARALGPSRETPFTKEIGDADLWVPSSRKGVVERLVETCRDRGHAVLAGEPGVGKTCILRALRHRLGEADSD